MKISTYIPRYSKNFFEHENPFDIFVGEILIQFLQMGHEIVQYDESADVNLIFNYCGIIRDDSLNVLIVDDSFVPIISISDQFHIIREKFEKVDLVIYRSEYIQRIIHKNLGKKKNEFIIPGCVNLEAAKLASVIFQKPNGGEYVSDEDDVWVYAGHLYPENGLRDSIEYFLKNSSENSILIVFGDPDFARWEIFSEMAEFDREEMDKKVIQLAGPSELDILSAILKCDKFINLGQFIYDLSLFYTAALFNRHVICRNEAFKQSIIKNNCTILDRDLNILLKNETPKCPNSEIKANLSHFLIERAAKDYISAITSIMIHKESNDKKPQ
tara:strand:- start:572 stop:1555 length:984 start_codon:yes stop_codon:yes gene_type:complete